MRGQAFRFASALFLVALAATPLAWAAAAGSTLDLAGEGEEGEPMVLEGLVADAAGKPLAGVEVDAVQTGADGYYKRGPGGLELGSRLARLKGRVTTGPDGRFRLDTIRPGAYPGRSVPAHIHFRVDAPGFDREELTLYFEGDPKLPAGSTDRAFGDARTYVRPVEKGADGAWRVSVELRPPSSRG